MKKRGTRARTSLSNYSRLYSSKRSTPVSTNYKYENFVSCKRSQIAAINEDLIPWIVAMGAFLLLLFIIFILRDKTGSYLSSIKDLLRFGK